jgi:hypothetical protein
MRKGRLSFTSMVHFAFSRKIPSRLQSSAVGRSGGIVPSVVENEGLLAFSVAVGFQVD